MSLAEKIAKEVKALNRQLYPTGRAWGYIHGSEQVDTIVSKFVDGLGNPFIDGGGNYFISTYGSEASPSKRLTNAYLKSYERLYENIFALVNSILADNEFFDETDASNWERVFGLSGEGLTLDERKTNILRKQGYPNGVAERGNYLFIQDQLQAAGFDVYVYENRFSDGGSGWNVVDPDSLSADVSGATYTGNVKDVNPQDIGGNGIFLSSDGTKLYYSGSANDSVFQYTLSTAFDISTATYDTVLLSYAAQTTNPKNIKFKPDGLKLYVCGDNTIFEYSLTVAWDLSTASYSGNSLSLTETNAADFNFKTDGLKLYILDESNNTIYQYSVATAFDLSTVTSDSFNFDFSYLTVIYRNFYFNEKGGAIYIGGSSSELRQYTLATPWNISTSSFKASLNATSELQDVDGIYLSNDDSKIYLLFDSASVSTISDIYEYDNPVEEVTICANYIKETTDNLYKTFEPSIPVELGVYEMGDVEMGRTSINSYEEQLRATFFIGGAAFPDRANVSESRKNQFRELILKLKPLQTVAQLLIDYTP